MGACERATAWLEMVRKPQHPPRSYPIDLLVIGLSIISSICDSKSTLVNVQITKLIFLSTSATIGADAQTKNNLKD